MHLREYMFYNGLSASELAALIDYSQSNISALLKGDIKYSRKVANAIEKLTSGKIEAKKIVGKYEPSIEELKKIRGV